jgi:cytoskeletal protein CcmA (bactofilin family)
MASGSVIGSDTVVRGNVRGSGPLEILGRVEGDVTVDGDVLLGEAAAVRGNVSGAQLTVSGAVQGDLRGTEAVLVQNGARVVGEIIAPRIGIADGGLVRGNVRTEGEPQLTPAARRPAFGTRPFAGFGSSRPVPAVAPRTVEHRPIEPRAVEARASEPKSRPEGDPAAKATPEPPPPVVPALPKGAKGKKKNRS